MEKLVTTNKNGRDVTTSLMIAKVFGKRHDNVLRDINLLNCSRDFRLLNFEETPYVYPQNGQTYKMYEITKDGFSFLVMGYTGEKAGEFKEKFIAEFNRREALLKDDDYIINRAMNVLAQRAKMLEEKVHIQQKVIMEAAPKVEYYDEVLQSASLIPTTVIAKDLGITAIDLNLRLHKLGIQFKVGNTWVLYQKYQDKGFTGTKTTVYKDSTGVERTTVQTYWTEKGREFIMSKMKQKETILLN